MSAIFGIYCLDGRPLAPAALKAMQDKLAHRGSDGTGLWQAGPVGLGHRLRRTTPESFFEQMPLVRADGRLVLTGDIRLDNRAELQARLSLSSGSDRPLSDGQLLLAAYDKWAENCPEHLWGDFAFAIWDAFRQQLFCARDHFGVKPFYYYHSDRLFVFASEIKALFCLPEVPTDLNEVRVADYLAQLCDQTGTFYRDVFRFPPAHCQIIRSESAPVRRYWSLDPTYELQLASDRAYIERFRDLFETAVQDRLRSAFPVGSLLSGGLDSSSITTVARQLSAPDNLSTFSLLFDETPEADEREFIQAVVAQGGLTPHYVRGDQISPLDGPTPLEDEPSSWFNRFLIRSCYQQAQQEGVRIILNGHGGDIALSDDRSYLGYLARRGRWGKMFQEAKAISRLYQPSIWQLLWAEVLKPLAPGPVRRVKRRLKRREWPWPAILNPDFARRIDFADRFWQMRTNQYGRLSSPRLHHHRILTDVFIPYMMEMVDRLDMMFGIEARYPFFDPRLAAFCLALPYMRRQQGGRTRLILRQAMSPYLPPKVQWRVGKITPEVNFGRTLWRFEKERLAQLTADEPGLITPYINMQRLQQIYRAFVSRQSTAEEDSILFLVFNLFVWLKGDYKQ